ncbi:MAG: hypothetical protein A2908_04250 [Candidatus Staskawiczbacteria bacterium RIFCSPLOWO2_01_FULL_38_12b]|uniref:Uncharacterized protein n=1 Tax=Candidatus Staskawiczbacteria bacterium RIFCSPLOWO2_01_FULL_38_12b TaxID=1802214 RepID=A0A1G2IFG8_9BACT|nr:MAG: hypothetical protein A2908_04250 [Candidatus Staskawiczbacteria bacterium RIFCSPLOWO2_01_FULL_38_12b]
MKLNIKEKEELKEFMLARKHLVWYVKNLESLSVESIIEHTLNYGSWEDVQVLIKILGIGKMAQVFKQQVGGQRTNYHKKTKNYFQMYFKKYA